MIVVTSGCTAGAAMDDITAAWHIQDAETRFSAVAEAALSGTPSR